MDKYKIYYTVFLIRIMVIVPLPPIFGSNFGPGKNDTYHLAGYRPMLVWPCSRTLKPILYLGQGALVVTRLYVSSFEEESCEEVGITDDYEWREICLPHRRSVKEAMFNSEGLPAWLPWII